MTIYAIIFIGIILFVVLYIIYSYMESNRMFYLDKIENVEGTECIITLRNPKGDIRTYRGSVTVWYNMKTGQRASSDMEYYLSGVYQMHKFKIADDKRKSKNI